MDFAIETTGIDADMTHEKSENILNNVYLSLMVQQGSFFQEPSFGSRLHELHRKKNTKNTELLAREYCIEALQWLKDTGRADKIDVTTERDMTEDLNRIKLYVTVTQTDGQSVTFETFLEVV